MGVNDKWLTLMRSTDDLSLDDPIADPLGTSLKWQYSKIDGEGTLSEMY